MGDGLSGDSRAVPSFFSTRLASTIPYSDKRHRTSIYQVPSSNPLDFHTTTYSTTHTAKFTPKWDEEAKVEEKDQPSGHSRNLRPTTIQPKDPSPDRLGIHARSFLRGNTNRFQTGADPYSSPPSDINQDTKASSSSSPSPSLLDSGLSERAYPPISDYQSKFTSPSLVDKVVVDDYHRNPNAPRFAQPSVISTGHGGLEYTSKHTLSGYATNNKVANVAGYKQNATSEYARVYSKNNENDSIPVLGTAQMNVYGVGNGFARNQLSLAGASMTGVGPLSASDMYATSYQNMTRASLSAPTQDIVPDPSTTQSGSTSHTAFSRSVLVPPAQGVGTLDTRFRASTTSSNNMSVDPQIGYTLPPQDNGNNGSSGSNGMRACYSAPQVSIRTGLGKEASQIAHEYVNLRKRDPLEFKHRIQGAPRYQSTYALAHGKSEYGGAGVVDVNTSSGYTSQSIDAMNAFNRSPYSEPSIESGGVRDAYVSTTRLSHKWTEDEHRYRESMNRINGKPIAPAVDTGYTHNRAHHAIGGTSSGSGSGLGGGGAQNEEDIKNQYVSTSHSTHSLPMNAAIPAISSIQIMPDIPPCSSYTKLNLPNPLNQKYVYTPPYRVYTDDGREWIDKNSSHWGRYDVDELSGFDVRDLHPTVQKSLRLEDAPAIKNHGEGEGEGGQAQ